MNIVNGSLFLKQSVNAGVVLGAMFGIAGIASIF
jgi:hypothetical protein